MNDVILTLNAGSSTLKFAFFEVSTALAAEDLRLIARGQIDEFAASPRLRLFASDGGLVLDEPIEAQSTGNAADLLPQLLHRCQSAIGSRTLRAVGHRIVHGGDRYLGPTALSDDVLDDLETLDSLAPLHQPQNLAAARTARAAVPDALHVGAFDTAFHQTMSPTARRFGLPRWLEHEGLKRFGFHGLSYEWLVRRLSIIDPVLAAGRVIYAHLGSGASLCAVRSGRSVDTTMGLSTLDGLVMSTRCGALDPGVVLHLLSARRMSGPEITDLLYKRSGLLGVSGISADFRVLMSDRSKEAAEAVDLFVFRIIREIGALTASLGGLDGLVFTGGIGEHSPEIRERICLSLEWLGFEAPNTVPAPNGRVSPSSACPAVYVIPADEERTIAAQARSLI